MRKPFLLCQANAHPNLQTATVRTPSPSPSDDDGRHDPDAGLDRQYLDPNGARKRFEHSTVDAQDVNFSDRLDSNRQSYKTKEKSYQSEDESLSRKLARLRSEAEEIRLELEKRKEGTVNGYEPETDVNVEDGVLKLSEMLDNLHKDSRHITSTKFTGKGAFSGQPRNAIPSGLESGKAYGPGVTEHPMPAEPPPGSATTAIAAFADRLSSLESALGLASVPLTNEATSILPTLASLSTQITTLSATLASSSQGSTTSASSTSRSLTSSSIPHLDALANRLRSLTNESDKLAVSRKRALEAFHELQEIRMRPAKYFNSTPAPTGLAPEHAASVFEDSSAKIAALYATLPTIQDLQPLLPVVLERLRSLQVLHADAAGVKGSMEDVEKQQATIDQEIERWRKGLEGIEAKMVEYQKVMGKNTEVIGKMVEDVEERLARLETQ